MARLRLNPVDTFAYEQCFRALFETVKEDHPKFAVGVSLLGIVTEWSDQKYTMGLQMWSLRTSPKVL